MIDNNGNIIQRTLNLGDDNYSPHLCTINGKMICYDWWTSSPRKSSAQGDSTYLGFGHRLEKNSFGVTESGHFYIRTCNKKINMEFSMLEGSIKKGRLEKMLKQYWRKKNFSKWITVLLKLERLTTDDAVDRSEKFLLFSNKWNNRVDIKHMTVNGNIINPCCTTEERCPAGDYNEMSINDVGWRCGSCGFVVGKHGYNI